MKLFNLTALLTTAIMGAATAAEPNQTTERGEILRIWPYSPWCNIASNEQLCTFSFYRYIDVEYWTVGYIYDKNCNEIGYDPEVGIGSFGMDSQLKYVVVGDAAQQTFLYAGKGPKSCTIYATDETESMTVTMCIFDCSAD